VNEVNRLLDQFKEMQKMMKKARLSVGKGLRLVASMRVEA
jgi:signal recognition particle GTPase